MAVEIIQPQLDRVRILGCFDPNYGGFYDTTDQVFNQILPKPMTLNSTDFAKHVEIQESSKIKIKFAGKYNIQFSAQFVKLTGGTKVVDIFLRKNGVNIPWSCGALSISGGAGAESVSGWNYFVEVADNDYFELMWYVDAINTIEIASKPATATHPAVPALILTVNQVG